MAKRRKQKKTSHRRRRVSGVALSAKSPVVQFGSIAAGYMLADTINTPIANVAGSLDPKIVAAAQAVAGFLIKKKVKGLAGQIVGGALIGAGAKKALKEFNVINGLPTVGRYRELTTVNGLPAPVRKVAGVAPGQSPSMQVIGAISNSYMD